MSIERGKEWWRKSPFNNSDPVSGEVYNWISSAKNLIEYERAEIERLDGELLEANKCTKVWFRFSIFLSIFLLFVIITGVNK
jgi:hypothetical protein